MYKKTKLLVLTFLFAAFYLFACAVVLLNSNELGIIQSASISSTLAERFKRNFRLHSSEFYSTLAQRLQYYSHSPEDVVQFYQIAIKTAPARHDTFFSFGYYLAARQCCHEQATRLIEESARRFPTNVKMYTLAATYFLAVEDKSKALPYFHRALQLDPHSAAKLYGLLERNKVDLATIVSITPEEPDSLMELSRYMLSRNEKAKSGDILQKIAAMHLESKQRLNLIQLMLSAGLFEQAQEQASLVFRDQDSRLQALRYLAEIAFQNHDWTQFEKLTSQIEKEVYSEEGPDRAAAFALETAQRLSTVEDKAAYKQRVLQIINSYPRYAPAYARMAALSDDSKELRLYYTKQAADLNPSEISYQLQLASLYMNLSRPQEAEKLFKALLVIPEASKDAYLGLARCKVQESDSYAAIAILEQGLERVPNQADLQLELGQLYLKVGEYERASRAFNAYAQSGGNPVNGFLQAGDALVKIGHLDQAREAYLNALNTDPQNDHARQALSQLNSPPGHEDAN
ncbi:MAG: hypothetical protein C5B54_02305 [Acidobacteria bacterium]|nr:MAG: hypothetical protein C5B54_02305 [Acidobacteriota bacterium]